MAIGVPNTNKTADIDYKIEYAGKKSEEEILSKVKKLNFTELKKSNSKSKNFLYFGDNLEVLGDLYLNPEIKGKVQLIYIDPPYATNSTFKNRNQKIAYNDNLSGANFIEFIRERLILMRELLSPTGSIYVHLDNKMIFEIKLIMDEVFGKKNFRSFITRKKSNPKNYSTKQYGNISDYILFYSRSQKIKFNVQYKPWDNESGMKEYQYIEENTGRRYKKVPIHAPGERNGDTGKSWRGMLPPIGKHWQYTPSKLDELDARGEIYWSPTGNPRRKIYLDQAKGIAFQDIWLDYKDAHNQNIKITGYPTEKNIDLLDIIIKASSDEGDIVLDAFAGSGTTLDAASRNNRNWIGIDNSHTAIETIIDRFQNGTKPMGNFKNANKESDSLFNSKYDISLVDYSILKA